MLTLAVVEVLAGRWAGDAGYPDRPRRSTRSTVARVLDLDDGALVLAGDGEVVVGEVAAAEAPRKQIPPAQPMEAGPWKHGPWKHAHPFPDLPAITAPCFRPASAGTAPPSRRTYARTNRLDLLGKMVLPKGIEPSTLPLPRVCSTD